MITGAPITVAPLTPTIGAEVSGVDLARPLDDATFTTLRDALLRWKVLFFRDQPLTVEQHVEFGLRWGNVTQAHPIVGAATPESRIHRLDSRQQRESERRRLADTALVPERDAEAMWHTDLTFVVNPALASILRAVNVPDHGGDTMWTDLAAAYQALSAPIRELVDGLRAVHVWHDFPGTRASTGGEVVSAAIHPVVRVHPDTGERAIFVSPMHTSHIVGVTAIESIELLDLLYDQIRRPEFTVRFRWARDSIAMWDNRVTAHLGPIDAEFAELERVMERVTIQGDIPYGPDGRFSESLAGDHFH
jgi:taurine dioxygenase